MSLSVVKIFEKGCGTVALEVEKNSVSVLGMMQRP
jgi:hypothetical protein